MAPRNVAVIVGWTLLAAVSAVSAAAEQPKSKDPSTASVTLRGCVVESMGRYMLNKPTVISPKPTPLPSASADPSPAKRADDQPYELLGRGVKPHVGHEVEVVGTMRAEAEAATPASDKAAPTAHPIAGRVAIKSLKVLTTTCP